MDEHLRRDNAQLLVCPWFSLSDRRELYRQLFDGSREEKMKAIRRIDAWKARSYPRVPLGIEVTMVLMEALAWEERDERDKPTPGVMASMFSMALVRFVNLVTEIGKASNDAASTSIISIAEKIGVPGWIVDLRHASTHSVIPSLHILKTAVIWSLGWVRLNYWEAEEEFIEDVVKMPAMYGSESVEKALHGVKADLLVISNCATRSKNGIGLKEAAKNRAMKVMKTIMRSMEREDLVQILLSDGLIFPDSQLLRIHSSEIEDDPCLAEHQFHLWWPVLHLFGKCGWLTDLAIALIAEMNLRSRFRAQFASAWIPLMIKKCGFIEKLKRKEWEKYVHLITILLKWCPAHAHLAISNFPKDKHEKLMALASTRAMLFSTRSSVFEDLSTRAGDELEDSECDHLVMACPLGLLPEQLESSKLDLELPLIVDGIFDQQKTTVFDDSAVDCGVCEEAVETYESHSSAWLL